MSLKGKILNIEIGDRIIKVCQSSLRGKSVSIAHSLLLLTPEGAVSDGMIADPEKMGNFLREQLQNNRLGDVKKAVLTLTSGKVATREVMLPPVKDKNLESIVKTNAPDYFPVDLSNYYITYQLLERVTTGEQQGCRVLVLAIPLSLLQAYLAVGEKAGLSVQAIDYGGNSQYQALRGLNEHGVNVYVNVDCGHTLITILNGDKFSMRRSFTFGGDDLIQAYMSAAGIAPADYIEALNACQETEDELTAKSSITKETVSEMLARVVSCITRGIEFFNSNGWANAQEGKAAVEKVVLMGACGHLAGLKELVAASTGLPTVYLDELPGISSLTNEARSISSYISCIGNTLAPLDLIPDEYRKRKKKSTTESSQSITPAVIVVAASVALSAVMCWFAISRYQNSLATQQKMENDISSLSYTKDVYNTYITFQKGSQALVDFSSSIDSPNDSLTAFIGELEKKMPSDILLLSATCTKTDILMNITVSDFDHAAVVLKQLRAFDSIRNITASSMEKATDETGASTVSFTVTCTYGENPWLNSTNPYAASSSPASSAASSADSSSSAESSGTSSAAN